MTCSFTSAIRPRSPFKLMLYFSDCNSKKAKNIKNHLNVCACKCLKLSCWEERVVPMKSTQKLFSCSFWHRRATWKWHHLEEQFVSESGTCVSTSVQQELLTTVTGKKIHTGGRRKTFNKIVTKWLYKTHWQRQNHPCKSTSDLPTVWVCPIAELYPNCATAVSRNNLIWEVNLEQGAGQDDFQRSHPTSAILGNDGSALKMLSKVIKIKLGIIP